MIIGLWHPGAGMGDQCFAYLAARIRAEDLGVPFGMIGEFKGASFMNIDRGEPVNLKYHTEMPSGKLVIDDEHKLFEITTSYYNPEVNFIEDGTVIDGCSAQDERYWGHRLNEIREWLKVEPLDMPDDICVCNFRGGEYTTVPDLFLPKEYWEEAISRFTPLVKFEVHTDDVYTAGHFLKPSPEYLYYQDIALNWRSVRYAKHLILSNSAFGILPALLNENVKEVIAPFGWNARNASLTKWLGRPMNYYKKFIYV